MVCRMNIRTILIGLALLIIAIQFIPRHHTLEAINPVEEFSAPESEQEMALLKSACYDCHSNETEYPWYAQVQPLAWWIDNYVEEGREKLNFSIWQTYSAKDMNHALEECIEMVEEKEMPLTSFTLTHPEARLSELQRQQLVDWFKKLRAEF